MDPYLPEDSIKYSTCLGAVSGFTGRIKTGYYGHGRKVGTGTVSVALTAIGQKISMDRPNSPLKMNGSDKLLHPLAVMISGLKKWDKPTEKKLSPFLERQAKTGDRLADCRQPSNVVLTTTNK